MMRFRLWQQLTGLALFVSIILSFHVYRGNIFNTSRFIIPPAIRSSAAAKNLPVACELSSTFRVIRFIATNRLSSANEGLGKSGRCTCILGKPIRTNTISEALAHRCAADHYFYLVS